MMSGDSDTDRTEKPDVFSYRIIHGSADTREILMTGCSVMIINYLAVTNVSSLLISQKKTVT